MTNPMINPQPNYSGVTIQIANPAVYAGVGVNGAGVNGGVNGGVNPASIPQPQQGFANCPITQNSNPYAQLDPAYNAAPAPQTQSPAYPPQYYLNNYNYQGEGGITTGAGNNSKADTPTPVPETTAGNKEISAKEYEVKPEEPQDFTKSQSVINDLDARAAAEAEAKKNSTQKRVVALTDEYIKSLENYLNNPNDEIRLMASKEILTRLDEDKDRFDDAALNALLNKMLQDPSKLIRVASLGAFASQLASGNDYTVTLLHNIQQNPNADKEDVLQAADILLKMSAGTEVKNIPNPAVKEEGK